MSERLTYIKDLIVNYPDFPRKGILFRDIFPIFRNPKALHDLIDILCEKVKQTTPNPEIIAGVEARGFLFGPMVAEKLKIPFVPVRKAGKLPGKIVSVEYSLEYGKDKLEVQVDSVKAGQNVIIVDDLLATGGTLKAAIELIEKLEVKVVACLVVIELTGLVSGNISAPVHSLIQF